MLLNYLHNAIVIAGVGVEQEPSALIPVAVVLYQLRKRRDITVRSGSEPGSAVASFLLWWGEMIIRAEYKMHRKVRDMAKQRNWEKIKAEYTLRKRNLLKGRFLL